MTNDGHAKLADSYLDSVFPSQILEMERCDDHRWRKYRLNFNIGSVILVLWKSHPGAGSSFIVDAIAHASDCIAIVHTSATAVADALIGRRQKSDLLLDSDTTHIWAAPTSLSAIVTLAKDPFLHGHHLEASRRYRIPEEPNRFDISARNPTPTSNEVIDILSAGGFTGRVTHCRHFDAGRIHDVFAVAIDGQRYIIQRVNEFVLNAGDLASTTNAVLGAMSRPESMQEWPTSGQYVYRVDSGAWIVRDWIEGEALCAPIDVTIATNMASSLRWFHQTMKYSEIDDAELRGVDPWVGAFTSAVLDIVRQPDRLRNPEELVVFSRLERARIMEAPYSIDPMDFGIVHRDAKPSNFLRTPSGELVLIDFDTVGRGAYIDDVGELARSIIAVDDDRARQALLGVQDVSEIVNAVVEGYQSDFVHPESVRRAACRAALRLAQRFFLDHINGNGYFSKGEPGDNLRLAIHNLGAIESLRVTEEVGIGDGAKLLVYLAAPNSQQGRLGDIALRRLGRFVELARSMADARLVLTGGFGSHFNTACEPHYGFALNHLAHNAPDIADRVEACLPTRHSYHDVLMSTWYACAVGSSDVTLVTSDYHQDRIQLIADLVTMPELCSVTVDGNHSTHGMKRESLPQLRSHEQHSLVASALTAVLFGSDDRIW